MTRANIVMLAAAALGALAAATGHYFWLAAVIAALAAAIGLGVALPQLRFFGPFICRGARSQNRVALTFDDGPDPASTPLLLDFLRKAGVPATFFCVGKRVAAHPELAARIVREGHSLQNHSFHHSPYTNFFTAARLRDELGQTQEVIRAATGAAPVYFRPPMGLSNPRTFRAAKSLGLAVIGWSARGLDTVCADPGTVVRRIARSLGPDGIILLHDGNIPPERVLATVKLLLETLRERGYIVVTLDQLLA